MRYAILSCSLLLGLACGESTVTIDAGGRVADTGSRPVPDSGAMTPRDARPADDAAISVDAAAPEEDAGFARDAAAELDAGFARDAMPIRDAQTSQDAGVPSGPCTMDSDCAPGGWCRPTMAGGNACVPWQSEGGSCGGFVIPHSRERCEPSLSCVGRHPLLADAPGICALPVTFRDLESMGRQYDGRVVAVTDNAASSRDFFGFIGHKLGFCTRRGCPQTDPCCNDCNAPQIVATSSSATSGIEIYSPMSMPYMCSGNECTDASNNRKLFSDNCELPPGQYRLIGTYRYGNPSQFNASVEPGMYP